MVELPTVRSSFLLPPGGGHFLAHARHSAFCSLQLSDWLPSAAHLRSRVAL